LIIFYILVTIPSKGKGLKPEPKQIKHQMAVRRLGLLKHVVNLCYLPVCYYAASLLATGLSNVCPFNGVSGIYNYEF
jgi:hypothetical protein